MQKVERKFQQNSASDMRKLLQDLDVNLMWRGRKLKLHTWLKEAISEQLPLIISQLRGLLLQQRGLVIEAARGLMQQCLLEYMTNTGFQGELQQLVSYILQQSLFFDGNVGSAFRLAFFSGRQMHPANVNSYHK